MTLRILSLILLLSAAPLSWSGDVHPPSAKKLPSIELGQALLLFMPDEASKFVGWDFRSEAQIVWLSDGYETRKDEKTQNTSVRHGLMRINVNGKKSTVLKKKKNELAWRVEYESNNPPKLGIETITLGPGTPTETCFGELYSGCAFDPIPSIKASGIKVKVLCGGKHQISPIDIGLELSHPGRRKIFASSQSCCR
ncbi:MAG: hypothetical protein Q7J80_09610 [Anaerolineales bacterium]|nr:hypothetical protein [Anaerolineales bacterium]